MTKPKYSCLNNIYNENYKNTDYRNDNNCENYFIRKRTR